MLITPIQTRYQGYRFRSRTEARWAVYLDILGFDWEYEKEGYEVGNTANMWNMTLDQPRWYLPDFWLNDWRCWLEIKGQAPTEQEIELCDHLHLATGYPVLLYSGLPGPDGLLVCHDSCDSSGGINRFNCRFADNTFLFVKDRRTDRTYHDTDWNELPFVANNYHFALQRSMPPMFTGSEATSIPVPSEQFAHGRFSPDLRKHERAIAASRAARFEHGETPKSR